ncbi:hypothetical protein B9Z55_023545 [Caenorhabditis nigoni]|uniref:Uncharacterized protein n=1 Tax=Caenorhabditis nigoni TaxID=1611254 RepID=A0A2G5SQG9_9PELO|nr:hypothetical protein B9Z55_023545 [Caenorhabditis nigoni]
MEKSVAVSSTSSIASFTAGATLFNPESHTSDISNSKAATSSDSIATSIKQNVLKIEKAEKTPTTSLKTPAQLSDPESQQPVIPCTREDE